MILLEQLSLRRGSHLLIDQANARLTANMRVGFIGKNGSGKSTLFALLLGQLSSDGGKATLLNTDPIAHMAQEIPQGDKTAIEYVIDGDKALRLAEAHLNSMDETSDGILFAKAHADYETSDPYTARARAAQLLNGLGFAANTYDHAVSSFSGGFRLRLNLAQALFCPSRLLLLDEPTNHLDLDAILWLETWLKRYAGMLIIISHDREFLDNTTSHILHLDQKQLTLYTGNYSSFEEQHAMRLEQQQKARSEMQRQKAHLQSFVDRFRAKASKARQAQSRIKALERLQHVAEVRIERDIQFSFKTPEKIGAPLIDVQHLSFSYEPNKPVLENIELQLMPMDRVAIIGVNGAGKSTLIKLLAGELTPSEGNITIHNNAVIAYFDQHQVESLDPTETPLGELKQIAPFASEIELRAFLGQFNFSNDRVFMKIRELSGGEKSRLALALLVYKKPNVLLLDEPTNHLDMGMREALTLALQSYEGALILISHDRFLIKTTVDQLKLLHHKKLVNFDESLDEYANWVTQQKQMNASNASCEHSFDNDKTLNKKDQRQLQAKRREQIKPLQQTIKRLEKNIAETNQALEKLQGIINDPDHYALDASKSKPDIAALLKEQHALKASLAQYEDEWLARVAELEEFQQQSDS